MDYEKELKKEFEEYKSSGYFFFVPERSLSHLMDLLLDEDVILLEPIPFKKSYFELYENECSVADTSEDDVRCLGQG